MTKAHIYLVTCKTNGKVYVGKTRRTISQRWSSHLWASRNGGDNRFYRAIRKHGSEVFLVEEISLVDEDRIDDLERFWIDYFQSSDQQTGYNILIGGDGAPHTPENKRKMSAIRKGMYQDPIFKARMVAASIGKHHTEEGRRNISLAQIGKPTRRPEFKQSAETKRKISESSKLAYAEGRHKIAGGRKKGTVLGPMSEDMKAKIAAGVSKVRREHFWSTKKKSAPISTEVV